MVLKNTWVLGLRWPAAFIGRIYAHSTYSDVAGAINAHEEGHQEN